MKICIFGAGAMGTSLGALLAQSGEDVLFVTRNEQHVDALNEKGVIIVGTDIKNYPVKASLPEDVNEEFDVLFVATKQRENQKIALEMRDYLNVHGCLVTVQNGLPEESFYSAIGEDRVYGCTLSWGAELVEPGVVKVSSSAGFRMGLATKAGERLSELKETLSKIGTVTVGDLAELRYAKLTMNAAFSTLSAITGYSFGRIANYPKLKKLASKIIMETIAVAKADGCKKLMQNGHDLMKVFATEYRTRFILPLAMYSYRYTRSGMLKDLSRGKRTDVDYVAGAVVKRAKALGVSVPTLTAAVSLVHDIENGFAESAPQSVQLLEGV